MLKNALVYRFEEPIKFTLEEIEQKLSEKPLTPCLTQEMESLGWITVFKDGQYVEKINDCLFINIGIETKQLPNLAVRTAVEKKIEEKGLKNISRSESKELYEIAMNELLPNALVVRSNIMAYIDLEKNWLVVDASSTKKASILTSYLRKTIGSLPIVPFVPDSSVNASMTSWALHGVDSDLLTLLYDIDLKELKDEGGNSKFRGVPLDSMEIQELLKSGWQVTKLGLSYDEQIAFSLAGDFIFKRLRTLERFQENMQTEDDPILQQQAELYLAVDLYRKMISHVYDVTNSCN